MTQSWIVRVRATGEPVCETWSPRVVATLNLDRYEAVPVLRHLQELNDRTTLAAEWARRDEEPQR